MPFEVADVYRSLRGRLFITDPKTLGLVPNEDERFWGLVVDIGAESGVVTLVVLRDGTISLYFSNGGALIGLDQHDQLHEPAATVLRLAEDYTLEGPEAERDSLPSDGFSRFNFLGFNGVRSVEEDDGDLEEGHPLTPLYRAVHELIAAAVAIDEKRSPAP